VKLWQDEEVEEVDSELQAEDHLEEELLDSEC
jgi:hypothetical protein